MTNSIRTDTVGEPTSTFQDRIFLRKLPQLFAFKEGMCMAKIRPFGVGQQYPNVFEKTNFVSFTHHLCKSETFFYETAF